MIAFRKRNEVLREVKFYTDKDIAWYGPDGGAQDWAHESRSLAAMIHGKDPLYLMFHAGFTEQGFVLPPAPVGRTWRCAVDTSRGVWPAGREEPLQHRDGFTLKLRSMAILIAR